MKSQIILLSLCLGIGLAVSSRAQMIGNPINTRGSGEWTISANGSYTNQQLGLDAVTKRLFIKSSWGITPWLDFYFLGGGVQLEMKSSLQNIADYKDKIRLGYGAGLNAAFKPSFLPIISVFTGVQAIRFVSEGSFHEDFYFNNQVYQSIYQMQYDCREVKGYAGLVFPHRIFRFYAAGAVWYLQRMETKKEYWDTGDSSILLGQQDGEYGSGIWTGGIVGMDLLLPQNFAISIECLIFNMSNYQIMVGVCQTGGTRW
jgi:hypothetical protein